MVDIESKHLTASNVGYWLKAKEWSARRAGMLLTGRNPGYWEFPRGSEQDNMLFINTHVDMTLAEIRHIKGRAVEDEWDRWSPRQWMDAATEAGIEIDPLLVEFAGVNDQPSATAGDRQQPDRGVTVTLPHVGKDLGEVFRIMRENWTNPDPKRLPKQVNIAREIDAALGWNPDRDGNPSRNARAIAALIKPDEINADDC